MSFFDRFFARRAVKTAADRETESWQVGDWAECMAMGSWREFPTGNAAAGPRHGRVGRVTAVRIVRHSALPGGDVVTLSFDGWPGQHFDAREFRKVNPRADAATAADAEFTALVRRKPAPAAPVETIRELQ